MKGARPCNTGSRTIWQTNITDSFLSWTELPTCSLVVVIVSIDFQPCDQSEPLLHQYQRLKPQGNLVL